MGDFFHETTTFNIYDLDGNLIDTITEIKDFDGEVENIFPEVDCINKRYEKEDNEMITAEEAKKIADTSNTDIELFLELINDNIKVNAHRGKYEYKEYYSKGGEFSKVVDTIKEKLEEKGYIVKLSRTRKIVDGFKADIFNYCMIIIWR